MSEDVSLAYLFRSENSIKVFDSVLENGGQSISGVARQVDIGHSTASEYLGEFEQAGLVVDSSNNQAKEYYPSIRAKKTHSKLKDYREYLEDFLDGEIRHESFGSIQDILDGNIDDSASEIFQILHGKEDILYKLEGRMMTGSDLEELVEIDQAFETSFRRLREFGLIGQQTGRGRNIGYTDRGKEVWNGETGLDQAGIDTQNRKDVFLHAGGRDLSGLADHLGRTKDQVRDVLYDLEELGVIEYYGNQERTYRISPLGLRTLDLIDSFQVGRGLTENHVKLSSSVVDIFSRPERKKKYRNLLDGLKERKSLSRVSSENNLNERNLQQNFKKWAELGLFDKELEGVKTTYSWSERSEEVLGLANEYMEEFENPYRVFQFISLPSRLKFLVNMEGETKYPEAASGFDIKVPSAEDYGKEAIELGMAERTEEGFRLTEKAEKSLELIDQIFNIYDQTEPASVNSDESSINVERRERNRNNSGSSKKSSEDDRSDEDRIEELNKIWDEVTGEARKAEE